MIDSASIDYSIVFIVANLTVFMASLANSCYSWYNRKINTIVLTQDRINDLNDTVCTLNTLLERSNERMVYLQCEIDKKKDTISILRMQISEQNDDILRMRKDLETSRICSNIITDCNLMAAKSTIEKMKSSIQDYRQVLRRWLYFKSNTCLDSIYKHDPRCEDVGLQVRTNLLKKLQQIEERYKTSSIKTDYMTPEHVPHIDFEG